MLIAKAPGLRGIAALVLASAIVGACTPASTPPATGASPVSAAPLNDASTALTFPSAVGKMTRGRLSEYESGKSIVISYRMDGAVVTLTTKLDKSGQPVPDGPDNKAADAEFVASSIVVYNGIRREGGKVVGNLGLPPQQCRIGSTAWLCGSVDEVPRDGPWVHRLLVRGYRDRVIRIWSRTDKDDREANAETDRVIRFLSDQMAHRGR